MQCCESVVEDRCEEIMHKSPITPSMAGAVLVVPLGILPFPVEARIACIVPVSRSGLWCLRSIHQTKPHVVPLPRSTSRMRRVLCANFLAEESPQLRILGASRVSAARLGMSVADQMPLSGNRR